MRIAVISANIGGFDTEKSIPKQTVNFDRYYYTDKNLPVPMHTQDARMKAKLMKIVPHYFLPNYDVYIWVDGNVQVKSERFIETILQALEGKDISISNHPFRSDIYHEAAFICDEIKKGNKYLSTRYSIDSVKREMGYITDQIAGNEFKGLYWCGCFSRVNHPRINEYFEQWFMDNILYSNFDQLSFVKMVNVCKLKVGTFSLGSFYDNDFYKLTHHLK